MDILKILARTGVLLVTSVIQVIGVIAECVYALLAKLCEYLIILDDKLDKPRVKKETEKTEGVPT